MNTIDPVSGQISKAETTNDSRETVNILMVDDQPANCSATKSILGELGENLIKASSGQEALELLLKNDIAVVLDGREHAGHWMGLKWRT